MTPSDTHAVLYAGPFHVALRRAVRDSGLTLDRLRTHLARRGIRVGLSSLSDWQTGRSRPKREDSPRIVAALEELLEIEPGALLRLLAVADDRRRVADVGVVAELLDAVSAGDQTLEVVSKHHKLTLDAEGRTAEIWSRTVVRAPHNGVDRFVGCYFGHCDPGLVQVEPLGNCHLGSRLEHPSEPALAYEVVFGERLRRGETWVFDMRLTDGTASMCSEFAFAFRHPFDQYVLEVQFDPGALPRTLTAFTHDDIRGGRQPQQNLLLSRHNSVHLVASAVDSGVVGIEWDWR